MLADTKALQSVAAAREVVRLDARDSRVTRCAGASAAPGLGIENQELSLVKYAPSCTLLNSYPGRILCGVQSVFR